MLSIIIPTYNEGDNISKIVDKINEVLNEKEYEIIFVDDSNDDTIQKLEFVSGKNKNVRYFHRINERGLATAVVKGFSEAKGEMIAVMDSDLQHPPEVLVSMLYAIEKENADIVLPTRFINGGTDGGLNIFRKLISFIARNLANIFIKKLREFSDNTSGYFMFKKEVIEECEFDPVGWKILIEVLVKGRYTKVIEIPYEFKARGIGQSKMSIKEQINYIKHIIKLIKIDPVNLRFFSFCIVGLSGVFINLIIYFILVKLTNKIEVSGFFSALTAMITNFILNDKITWRERKSTKITGRIIKNFITSIIGIGINILILFLLERYTKIHYILANIFGIGVATIWNYVINNLWTWKNKNKNVEKKVDLIRWDISKSNKIIIYGELREEVMLTKNIEF